MTVHVLVAIVVALWQLQPSFSQFPDLSDPCASSATQLHSGDIAYFPTFDYPTGSHQETATEGEGDGPRKKRAATSLDHRLWPDGVVYYRISDRYTDEENRTILEAMKHWEDHTCIRFQQRTTQRVYIDIFPGSGCCSYIGRIGYGLQGVSVGKECLAFHTVLHELGHAIGFWHEQSRPDRDQHIEVILVNVIPGFANNFDKKGESEIDSLGVGYDYNSIMHYDRNFFARFSSFDTIRARDPSIPIGLARELSELDILQTNMLYNCDVNNMPPPRVVLPELPPTAPPTLPPLPFPSCGAVFVSATGSFSSPSYPTFTHNTDCAWMINGPAGHWIRLSFSPLRIEYSSNCGKDYIIIERSFEESANPNKICGHYFNYRFSSHDNTVMVRYHTDGDNSADSRTAYGFQVSYESFDIDECYTAGCSQDCHNYPGSYSCSCRDGWFLSADGVTCFDMNECALESGGCEHHCTNTGGSFYCTCDDGFNLEPNGKRCRVPGTSCSFRNGGCSHHCNDTGVSRICSCDAGYNLRSDQRTCRDIDECAVSGSSHGCQHTCVNTPGSYRCECNNGFLLGEDQRSCLPERTCATNNGGCSHSCRDSNDGALCSCPQGYRLGSDQMTCEDIDECFNSRLCGHVCVNTNGSYHCDCWEGYSLDSDEIFCRNIDECRDGSNQCQFDELCRDNDGSYTCRCPSGYTLEADGHRCKDKDECAQGYHICSHTCHNLNGTYECTCPSGFTLRDQYTCRDVDECATGLQECNLPSGTTCKNTDGSYVCLCQDGYKTDNSGLMCIDIDECGDAGSHDCKEGSECVNYEGYYECKCSLGYQPVSEESSLCEPITTTLQPTTTITTQETTPTIETLPPFQTDTTTTIGNTRVTSAMMTTSSNENQQPDTSTAAENPTTTPSIKSTTTDQESTQPTESESNIFTTAGPTISDFDKPPITTTMPPTKIASTTASDLCGEAGCEHVCRVKINETSAAVECHCRDGYILAEDGKTCEDVDECLDGSNGRCDTYCMNLAGSYECLCRSGYLLDTDGKTCKDINECEENNGGCGQTCTNMPGSFACNCLPNHYLAIDGRTCVSLNPLPPPTTPPAPSVPPTSPSSDKNSSTVTTTVAHTTSPTSEERPTVAQPLCGGDLKSANGTFQTLNWPQTYPVNVDCEWSIEIPNTEKVIEISFDRSVFGVAGRLPNCEKDWVKVYDGPEASTEASSWGPFCHYRVPDTIQTSSHEAKIVFHAGPVHNPSRRGFKASYVSVNRIGEGPRPVQVLPQNPTGFFGCHGFLLADNNFGPPEFPNLITSNTGASCSWTLAGYSSSSYAFKLIYFNIPSSPDCHDNNLKVYSSVSRTPANLLATLCGELSEADLMIEGGNNFMTVVLEVNDRSVSFRGFYGYFEQQN